MRLDDLLVCGSRFFVSIHASVKDATLYKPVACNALSVSIHASVKDATKLTGGAIEIHLVSIHASVKDATGGCLQHIAVLIVSIHASVKDATRASNVRGKRTKRFNPRICKRCDIAPILFLKIFVCFNPRICKRCDSMFVKSFIDDTFKL